MKTKTWMPLALALGLGLLAAIMARSMISQQGSDTSPADSFIEVVVARNNLPAGMTIALEDLAIGRIEKAFDAGTTFTRVEELEGRVIQAPVFKGLPVLASQLAPRGVGGGLQALVPPGMRAITVEVNEFSGVGGFLVPGCHVDVIATVPARDGEIISRTIVQRVQVSAVGQRMTLVGEHEQKEQVRSITLIASLKEAEAIELSTATGRPRLVLRSSGDEAVEPSMGVAVADLRGNVRRSVDPFSLPFATAPRSLPPAPLTAPAEPAPAPQAASTEAPQFRIVKVIRAGIESELNRPVEPRDEQKQQITGGTFEAATK